MIIKINELEEYKINFPQENESINIEKLYFLIERLSKIAKVVGKDPLIQISQQLESPIKEKRHYQKSQRGQAWRNIREEAIRFLTLMYHGTKEEKIAYANIYNLSWNRMVIAGWGVRNKFNIKPEEVKMIAFPTNKEIRNYEHLKIK